MPLAVLDPSPSSCLTKASITIPKSTRQVSLHNSCRCLSHGSSGPLAVTLASKAALLPSLARRKFSQLPQPFDSQGAASRHVRVTTDSVSVAVLVTVADLQDYASDLERPFAVSFGSGRRLRPGEGERSAAAAAKFGWKSRAGSAAGLCVPGGSSGKRQAQVRNLTVEPLPEPEPPSLLSKPLPPAWRGGGGAARAVQEGYDWGGEAGGLQKIRMGEVAAVGGGFAARADPLAANQHGSSLPPLVDGNHACLPSFPLPSLPAAASIGHKRRAVEDGAGAGGRAGVPLHTRTVQPHAEVASVASGVREPVVNQSEPPLVGHRSGAPSSAQVRRIDAELLACLG